MRYWDRKGLKVVVNSSCWLFHVSIPNLDVFIWSLISILSRNPLSSISRTLGLDDSPEYILIYTIHLALSVSRIFYIYFFINQTNSVCWKWEQPQSYYTCISTHRLAHLWFTAESGLAMSNEETKRDEADKHWHKSKGFRQQCFWTDWCQRFTTDWCQWFITDRCLWFTVHY